MNRADWQFFDIGYYFDRVLFHRGGPNQDTENIFSSVSFLAELVRANLLSLAKITLRKNGDIPGYAQKFFVNLDIRKIVRVRETFEL